MRDPLRISILSAVMLASVAIAGCDGDTDGTGGGGAGGSGGSHAGGAGGGAGGAGGGTGGGVASACPSSAPPDGEACSKLGLVCETDDGIVLVCRSRTTCTDTGWKTIAPGCSSDPAPDPTCPAAPQTGPCDVEADAPLCDHGDTFCGCSDCLGGPCGGQAEWVCAMPPAAPCPAIAPRLGAPCADAGQKCVYGACPLGGTSGGRTCLDGVWTEDIVNCPL